MNRVPSSYQIADNTFPSRKKMFQAPQEIKKKKNITKKCYLCVYIYWWGRMHVLVSHRYLWQAPLKSSTIARTKKKKHVTIFWHIVGQILFVWWLYARPEIGKYYESPFSLFDEEYIFYSWRPRHEERSRSGWLAKKYLVEKPHKSFANFETENDPFPQTDKNLCSVSEEPLEAKDFRFVDSWYRETSVIIVHRVDNRTAWQRCLIFLLLKMGQWVRYVWNVSHFDYGIYRYICHYCLRRVKGEKRTTVSLHEDTQNFVA